MATIPLTRHDGPIDTDHDGQVIQNLDIYVDSGPAVVLDNNNVVLKNVRIHYNEAHTSGDAMGVLAKNASGITIQNVEVINDGAPASGPETNPDHYNIMAQNATNLHITDATLRDGSTGVYLIDSPGAVLQGIEGYDFRGPFPRGQLVQFNNSPNGSLSDFYVHNDPKVAFTEDNVSVYQSHNVTIQRGIIDGNNSPSGQGVIFEGSNNGRASHIDAIHMGNGAFASYGNNNTFDYTRSFDNIVADQGRGAPMSGAVIWTLNGDGNTVTHSSYQNPAVPNNIVYDYHNGTNSVNVMQVGDAAPQTHWANDLHWITDAGPSSTDPATPTDNSGSGATAGGTDSGNNTTDPGTPNGNSGSGATAGGTNPGDTGTAPGSSTGNSGTNTAGNDTPQVHFEHGDHRANDLVGSAVDDVMLALGGNDRLAGGLGNDHLLGGRGSDILFGGAGNDEIRGGAGRDVIEGGAGADVIYGGGDGGKDILLLSGRIDDYTIEVRGQSVRFTHAGETDVVRGVEQFHFLGDDATYAVKKHALVEINTGQPFETLLARASAWNTLQTPQAEATQQSNTGLAEITELDLASGAKPAANTPDPVLSTAVESIDASAHVDLSTALTAHDHDNHHIFG
jgi:Ca2+-binding RTX toxin-like protein